MLPAVFVGIAMFIALSLPTPNEPPPIILSPSQYLDFTQPRGNFIPYSDQAAIFPLKELSDDKQDANASQLIKTFFLPSGIGASCVLNKNKPNDFQLSLTFGSSFNKEFVHRRFNPECDPRFMNTLSSSLFRLPVQRNVSAALHQIPCACNEDGDTYTCSKSYGKFPATHTVASRDHLIDITGKAPMIPYLMYTTRDYHMHRYGAISFNEIRNNTKPISWPSGSPLRKLAVRESAQVFFNHKVSVVVQL